MSSEYGDFHRGRRLRRSPGIRALVRESEIRPADLVMPYFVAETDDAAFRKPIGSMPGQFQLSLAELEKQVGAAVQNGLAERLIVGLHNEVRHDEVRRADLALAHQRADARAAPQPPAAVEVAELAGHALPPIPS
jgi:delta-aminolevulinic acid dehydratase/porphobilinogen synthase